MRNNSFFKIILIAITVIFFTSCDKDFNSIGGDLIGNEHFGLESKSFDVISYNQKIGPVQSNNLPVNALGVYDNSVFGTTEASFATQVVLAAVNPTIGVEPVIDNVVLSVPYFSHKTSTDATSGDSVYVLDSIFGNPNGKIKLSVYENGYFMRDLDPLTGFLEKQKYYTNQGSEFDGLRVSQRLNDSIEASSQNEQFVFDAKEFKDSLMVDGVKSLVHKAPEMRLFLNKGYFKTRIIDAAASGKLITNDIFKDYFRGLYFKVEKSGSNPAVLALMDFTKGTITINYKENLVTTVDGVSTTTRVSKSIVLNLTGNTVSLLSNTNAPDYATATNPNVIDTIAGDKKLYLKGGEGSMAVLDLFDKTDNISYDANGNIKGSNNIPDQLDELRRKDPVTGKKTLINEANLVFHVDEATMGTNKIPSRVYLYDLTNNNLVVDYLYDGTTGATAKNGMLIYSGLLNATKTDDKTYKIRITNHIRSLINNADSTNVKLGVVITEDIKNIAMNKLRLPLPEATTLTKAPQASVMSPLGVVLYGGTTNVPDDKKLKLEIYYTKPN